MVAHAYNSITQEVEIGRSIVQDQHKQKIRKTLSEKSSKL
jgi:hypothetical protein